MKKVVVIYFTHTDTTGKLAGAIVEGAGSIIETEVIKLKISGEQIVNGRFKELSYLDEMLNADAVIFGTPTYMGNVSAQFKAFADASSELWCDQAFAGKLAAGFTCGSAPNGDQSNSLQYMVTLANQHGMFWVGLDSALGYEDKGINRLGCQLGVTVHSSNGELNDTDRKSAFYLGQRVATVAHKFTA